MRSIWMRGVIAAGVLALAAGCGEKSEPAPDTAHSGGASTAPAVPEGPTVELSGAIHFNGTPPERKPIRMSADPNCDMHKTEPVLTEDVVVGPDGGLQNVLVSIQSGLPEGLTLAPAGDVVLDQKGCTYIPHVWAAMANQTIRIRNSDNTLHNVHGIPETGDKEFNVGMPRQNTEITRTFTNAGNVRFKCDVHPWMMSYGRILSHPYYAVSDAQGHFTIAHLPPGTYTVEAWHEKLGTKTASVTIGENGETSHTLDFTFEPAAN